MKKLYTLTIFVLAVFTAKAQWDSTDCGTTTTNFTIHIYFVNDNVGYVAGGAANGVVKTIDGGTTWSNISPGTLPSGNYSDIYFLNADTGFLSVTTMTGGPVYYKTINGGINWTDISSSCGIGSQGANDLEFINSTTGFAVGGLGSGSYIYKTTDGGNTYSPASNPTINPLANITFINNNIGFLADNSGGIYKTINQGASWSLSVAASAGVNQIYFVTDSIGFATGTGGSELYRTTNQGASWTILPVGDYLVSIVFANSMIGYVSSIGGLVPNYVYKTTDGGANWNVDATLSGARRKYQFFKTPNNTLFLTADTGIVYRNISYVTDVLNQPGNDLGMILISPNPSTGIFTLQSTTEVTAIEIYDVLGDLIYTSKENISLLDISAFADGVYFLILKTENGTASKKLIKN